MSDTGSSKLSPEAFVLKGTPRRVVRFKRTLLIGIAAVGCVGLFGVTWIAFTGSGFHPSFGNDELLGSVHKNTPDALAGLPEDYGQMAKPETQLGPPLPGDLGRAIVEREKQLGVNPASAEDEAARAERLRLAQQAEQAREATVFFPLNQRSGNTAAVAAAVAMPTAGMSATSPNDAGAARDHLNLDADRDQNDQQRKVDFVNQATERNIYNDHVLQTPASPYEVLAGTVISASLLTGLDSDLPGLVTAQVTEDIRDTVTGKILLIPQGARLVGTYDSVVAFGQSRALLVWQRIVMPDGSSITIDNLPATDTAGYAGLEDEVDFHTWQLLKGVALSTLLGTGTQVTFGNSQSNLVQAIRQSTQESTNEAGQRLVEKTMTIQPTIRVRPGWPLRVIVHKDLVLAPYRVDGQGG